MNLQRLALPLLLATAATGQIPDTFKNLQVLPKEIAKPQLIDEMKRFSVATGLRCEGCHAGKGGPALEAMDWASDEKETKRTARAMVRMVRAINDDHIARLARPKSVQVTCATCHRGISKPVLLDALLVATVREKGLAAAVTAYRELRRAHYGGAAYDFSDRTLCVAAEALLAEGRAADALGLIDLNVEFGAKDVRTHVVLSDARLGVGDRPGALTALRKALEVDPKAEWVRKKLERLEKGAP